MDQPQSSLLLSKNIIISSRDPLPHLMENEDLSQNTRNQIPYSNRRKEQRRSELQNREPPFKLSIIGPPSIFQSNGISTDRSSAIANDRPRMTTGFSPQKYSTTKAKNIPSIQFQEQLQKYIPSEKTDRTTFELNFLSHRSGLKDFYKNQQYKVITNQGDLVANRSKILIERSRRLSDQGHPPSHIKGLRGIQLEMDAHKKFSQIPSQIDNDPLFDASHMRSHDNFDGESQIQTHQQENDEQEYEYKKVKYVQLVPKKFKENYEVHFQDVFQKGQIYTMFEDQAIIQKKRQYVQNELIKHLASRGEGCKKGGRKCSVEKQFDLVDIENLAFSNLFIEPQAAMQAAQMNRDQTSRQSKTASVKVSQYPRASMPTELKSRFEIDIKSGQANIKTKNGDNENLYNDQFWRKSDLDSLSKTNKLPFFQQFRPETCYKWSSQMSTKNNQHNARTQSMFTVFKNKPLDENEYQGDEGRTGGARRSFSQMGKYNNMTQKKMWQFGGFNERPEWFSKMIMMGSNIKRKCNCCNRFKCLKYLRQNIPNSSNRPQTQIEIGRTDQEHQLQQETQQIILSKEYNQKPFTQQVERDQRNNQVLPRVLQQREFSTSSIDSNQIVNAEEALESLSQNIKESPHEEISSNHQSSTIPLYKYQYEREEQFQAYTKNQQVPSLQLNNLKPSLIPQGNQNNNNASYSAIDKLLQNSNMQSWDHQSHQQHQDDNTDYAQIPISDRLLKSNIQRSIDNQSCDFKPFNIDAVVVAKSKMTTGPSAVIKKSSKKDNFAKSIFKQKKVQKAVQSSPMQKWTSPFEQRVNKDKGKIAYLNINQAVNLNRPKDHIGFAENNQRTPGYISRTDLNSRYHEQIQIKDSSVQLLRGGQFRDKAQSVARKSPVRQYHILGPFNRAESQDSQMSPNMHNINMHAQERQDSLYYFHNIDIATHEASVDVIKNNNVYSTPEDCEFQNDLLKDSYYKRSSQQND